MPAITFFIPAYNCSETVGESVSSIMETNFNDGDELVIVNDASSDDTSKTLQLLKKKYPSIVIVEHLRNKGGAAARNTAVENAKNELLFCLDSDNVLEKNSIKSLKDFMIAKEAEIACFRELRYFSENISLVEEVWAFEPPVFTIQDLLSGKLSPGASGNYLFTKSSWLKAKGYTEDMGALDTWSFGFKQLIENCKMVVMSDGYYFHRRGQESYFMRDAWNRRKSISLRLIKLIINYIDLFHPADVNYIFSKRGRYTWFDNLKKRPVRLLDKASPDAVWAEHDLEKGILNAIKNKGRHYKSLLSQTLKSKG